ncbi:hypothetical protein N0V88_004592 [Collariella sp. IMI 366227]|nr:hypothetical protein N0V88_004592 [Collariella sp. IMI 366227]
MVRLTQTKAGRVSKPSAKKRARNESDEDEDGHGLMNGTGFGRQPETKKTKITLKTPTLTRQPTLKLKPVGRIPHKPLGEGYDSEAEDREVDPVIEEQFLFRMMRSEHLDYLRKMVQEKKIGVPKAQGGADFSIKWLPEDDGRRAMVTVQGQHYAASLVDLPTITEGMKTWDKKAMVKSSDICQMLLVFAPVQNEEEAKTVPLPKAVDHGHRWPHGITPPMHDARNLRFRKRLSKLEIKNKEAEVERLLASDREARTIRTEWIDSKQDGAADEEEEEVEYEEDAEGEEDDYFGDAGMKGQYEEEELELDPDALEAAFMEAAETPAVDIATPMPGHDGVATAAGGTPVALHEEEEVEEEESDEDEEDEDEEGDGDDGDEGEDRHAGVRNEIAALKKQLKQYEEQLAASQQPIMRKRLETNIRNLKSEIQLRMSAIGEVEED